MSKVEAVAVSRREQILASAAKLFYERGYHGTGIDEIGANVGVTGPAVYRHFEGKQAVLDALLASTFEQVLEETLAIVARGGSPAATARALIEARVALASGPLCHRVAIARTESVHASVRCQARLATTRAAYLDEWMRVMVLLRPRVAVPYLRMRVDAALLVIGHTVSRDDLDRSGLDEAEARRLLTAMAWSILMTPTDGADFPDS